MVSARYCVGVEEGARKNRVPMTRTGSAGAATPTSASSSGEIGLPESGSGIRRSSSVSELVGMSTGIQARLSQSDYLAGAGSGSSREGSGRVGGADARRRGEEEVWLASRSVSSLDDFVVSIYNLQYSEACAM